MNETKKYLVFTSAGDNSNVHNWLVGNVNFDVWVCYYGDTDFPGRKSVRYYSKKKGGKFQNLHYLFNEQSDIFKLYSSVLIMDDDILISSVSINTLFEVHAENGLQLLQPAYDKTGKISHDITARRPFTKLRYTNFIEITAPLFTYNALNEFMQAYDPIVNATAVDWWFCTNIDNSDTTHRSIAICDSIWCINPHDLDKSSDGVREIDRLLSNEDRIRTWQMVREKHNLQYVKENEFKLYESVSHFNLWQIISWFLSHPLNVLFRVSRKIKKFERKLFK